MAYEANKAVIGSEFQEYLSYNKKPQTTTVTMTHTGTSASFDITFGYIPICKSLYIGYYTYLPPTTGGTYSGRITMHPGTVAVSGDGIDKERSVLTDLLTRFKTNYTNFSVNASGLTETTKLIYYDFSMNVSGSTLSTKVYFSYLYTTEGRVNTFAYSTPTVGS